jgi:hypothetical protein
LINKPAFGFRDVVALQLGNSKTRHSKEWSELALWLKNRTSHLLHAKVKDKMIRNPGPGTCRQTNPYLGDDNWGKFRILLNIYSEKTCSEKNSEFFFSLKKILSQLFRVN